MKKWEVVAEDLRSRLKDASWPPGGYLPTVRELAAAYQVSAPTVLQAVAYLRSKDLLVAGGARERIRATGRGSRAAGTLDVPGTRSMRLAQQIRVDIVRGEFVDGFLPSAKQLRTRYACSHATLRKALAGLCELGLLAEDRAHYRVTFDGRTRKSGTRVFVAGGSRLLRGYQDHAFSFVLSLERQVQRMGWGPLSFFLTDNPLVDPNVPADHRIGGLIYVLQGAAKEWATFLKRRPGIPLILVDLQESMRWSLRNGIFFRVMPNNRRAGLELARHLHQLGHRNIALFTHVDMRQNWASRRYDGIGDVFGNQADCRLSLFELEVRPSHDVSGVDRIRGAVSALRRTIDRSGRILPVAVRDEFSPVYSLLEKYDLSLAGEAQFERALADTSITAWVCMNDAEAVVACSFLSHRGKKVPQDISVAAFDNSPISYQLGLTSYDFTMERMAHEALRCLQDPQGMAREGTIRHLPGQLVPRSSTAAVR